MPEIINKQKAPKDILLNSILQEIDEENGVTVEAKTVPKKNKSKKKPNKKKEQHPLLRVLFYFLSTMIVLFLMFMIVMITLTEEEVQENKKEEAPLPTVSTPHKFVPKKEYHFEDFSKPTLKEEGNKITGTMQKKEKITEPVLKEKTRKTAKEILLEQMQK